MGSSAFSLKALFTAFLSINQSSSSFILNALAIVLYFSQSLSYLFKSFIIHDPENQNTNFLFKIVYYSNMAHFLEFFNNSSLNFVVYMLAFFMQLFLIAYTILYSIHLSSKFGKFNSSFSSKVFAAINPLVSTLFHYNYYIFIIPSIEVLLKQFYCSSSDNDVACSNQTMAYSISVFGIALAILIGGASMWLGRSYSFLDEKTLRQKFSPINALVYWIRVALPILYGSFSGVLENLIFTWLALQFSLMLIDTLFFNEFPLRNPINCKIYYFSLFGGSMVLILIFFYNFSQMVTPETLFFVVFPLTLLTLKLGRAIMTRKSESFQTSCEFLSDFGLEELVSLFSQPFYSERAHFLFVGILGSHSRKCKQNHCKVSRKRMVKFEKMDLADRKTVIMNFVIHSLSEKVRSKADDRQISLMTYMTFLIECDLNPTKTYFEIQKVLLSLKNRSYFNEIIVRFLILDLQKQMKENSKIQKIQNFTHLSDQIELSAFFSISHQKEKLQKKMIYLLNEKNRFLERYKQGMNSYDDILGLFYRFITKAEAFKAKLEGCMQFSPIQENLILLKFSSIFYSVVLNNIQKASSFEDEVENIRKRYAKVHEHSLSPLIFLNVNLVTCEASFLTNEGRIFEKSKNEKFASLFNYEFSELKNVKLVSDLMPKFIADYHQALVFWSFERSKNEEVQRKTQISSFAKERQGFIFPVRLFLGFNLHYFEDFVLHAGILSLNSQKEIGLLFESKGNILGVTRPFYEIYSRLFPFLSLELFQTLNVYSLISNLSEIVEKNHGFSEGNEVSFRNLTGRAIFPGNLEEIIRVIAFKLAETESLQAKNEGTSFISSAKSIRSNRTLNSKRSEKNQIWSKISHFLGRYTYKTDRDLDQKKAKLMKIFEEDLNNRGIFNELCNNTQFKSKRIIYDLSFSSHRFGKHPDQVLLLSYLKINKTLKFDDSIRKIASKEGQNMKTLESDILNNSERVPIQLPPENLAEFGFVFNRSNEALPSPNALSLQQEKNILPFLNSKSSQNERDDKPKNENHFMIKPDNEKNTISDLTFPNLQQGINSSYITKQAQMEEPEKRSGKPSSVNSFNKQSLSIFHIIQQIQSKLPRMIFLVTFSLFLQITFLLAYCVFIYLITTIYIDQIYTPMRDAAITQCRINTGMTFSCLSLTEFELAQKNFTKLEGFYLDEMKNIILQAYNMSLNEFFGDQMTPNSFSFGNYFTSWFSLYVNQKRVETVLYSDLSSPFYKAINSFIRGNFTFTEESLIISRNFPYYLKTSLELRGRMFDEFSSSNSFVTNNIATMMILMLISVFLLKLLEYFFFSRFYLAISKLINIFLRVNQREVLKELLFLKDVILRIKDSHLNYLYVNFAELTLKKQITLGELNEEVQPKSVKKDLKIKKKKANDQKSRTSFFNIRSFAKTRIFIFLCATLSLTSAYFVGVYYDWVVTNDSISQLLLINTIFNQIYFSSSASLVHNTLFMREQLIRNYDYEASGEFYQNHNNRLKYFFNTMNKRLNDIIINKGDLFAFALQAKPIINDPFYDEIMEGDTCDGLNHKGFFSEVQYNYCKEELIQYQNGLVMEVNDYINGLRGETWINVLNQTEDIETIREFLSTTKQQDKIIANFYLSNSLQYFYEYSTQYYSKVLNSQLGNLKIVVWVVCAFATALLIIIGILSFKFLREGYHIASGGLGLIPYEKLSNDEQTIFLIKRYWKEHGGN